LLKGWDRRFHHGRNGVWKPQQKGKKGGKTRTAGGEKGGLVSRGERRISANGGEKEGT